MKENTITTNFKTDECVIFVQTPKIGTHDNKTIHSTYIIICFNISAEDFHQNTSQESRVCLRIVRCRRHHLPTRLSRSSSLVRTRRRTHYGNWRGSNWTTATSTQGWPMWKTCRLVFSYGPQPCTRPAFYRSFSVSCEGCGLLRSS